jgi:hypothetical protein
MRNTVALNLANRFPHKQHDNKMVERTTGAIALRPTGNAQGGFYFYSLTTGRVLNRNQWTELPMPTEVIKRIEGMVQYGLANLLAFAVENGVSKPLNAGHNGRRSTGRTARPQ